MKFCNIEISDLNRVNLFNISQTTQVLIPMNAECIVRCNENHKLLSIVNRHHTTIDGQIPLWLFKRKYPAIPIEKISGSDIVFDFCSWSEQNNFRVFFLGGKELSNRRAINKIHGSYPNLSIDGYSPPYERYPFSKFNNDQISLRLERFKPDIIFVGFGFGKQELWVEDNLNVLQEFGVKWCICCGGTFEFISGEIKRAPKIIQKCGLEGLWRLIMEPKLFRIKRLLVSFKIFKYIKNDH